ncbi:MAG: hypothetical protein ACQCN3_02550 [Candidatus Bathyarchaeia archaeon]|jgi:hypothetical protein
MEKFKMMGELAEVMKKLTPVLDLVKLIMPVFKLEKVTVQEVEGDIALTKSYAAVLFEQTEENKRRVTAISDIFTDILPPFQAVEDFELEQDGQIVHFAALLFEVPEEKQQ